MFIPIFSLFSFPFTRFSCPAPLSDFRRANADLATDSVHLCAAIGQPQRRSGCCPLWLAWLVVRYLGTCLVRRQERPNVGHEYESFNARGWQKPRSGKFQENFFGKAAKPSQHLGHLRISCDRQVYISMSVTVGVLALQGGFAEHVSMLERAAAQLISSGATTAMVNAITVRAPAELAGCDALVIPGGESTTMALIATQSGLLEPLRDFVRCVTQ